jgi:hypothetical protein
MMNAHTSLHSAGLAVESRPQSTPEPPHVMSVDERQAVLAQELARLVAHADFRIEAQTETMAVMARGHRVNHLLHFYIGVFTLGVWWFTGWPAIAIFGGEKRSILAVDDYGNVLNQKVRSRS